MLGKPKYNKGYKVKFNCMGKKKVGLVYIVDAYGTFDQSEEPSYDVMIVEENCLYKHIRESQVQPAD